MVHSHASYTHNTIYAAKEEEKNEIKVKKGLIFLGLGAYVLCAFSLFITLTTHVWNTSMNCLFLGFFVLYFFNCIITRTKLEHNSNWSAVSVVRLQLISIRFVSVCPFLHICME